MRPAQRVPGVPLAARPTSPGKQQTPEFVTVTVVDITPGGAEDGNNLVTVDWAGTETPAAYLAHYTPVVGHHVTALYQSGQLLIIGRPIGTP